MHLIASAKNDISGVEMVHQFDPKSDTAWLIKQKLMEAMRQRNSINNLEGDVQIDYHDLGDEAPTRLGENGRGAANKPPFLVAAAVRDGQATYAQIRCLAEPFPVSVVNRIVPKLIRSGYVPTPEVRRHRLASWLQLKVLRWNCIRNVRPS